MIGIIGAMAHEVELLFEKLENKSEEEICGMLFYTGNINSIDVVITKCGVGKVNAGIAAAIMIDTFMCELLINSGIAGGLQNVSTGDVIIASKLMYHDFDTTQFGYKLGQVPGFPVYYSPECNDLIKIKAILNKEGIPYSEGMVLSGDSFVNSRNQIKEELITPDTKIVCEMEGAAVAQVALKAGVSFIVLRFVSDIVDSPSQIKDYAAFETEASEKSALICFDVLNNLR
jgi:adenosylhomocysteine nucleosidase